MKPGTAKSKGRETENLLVEFLNKEYGLTTERRRLNGSADKGDIAGWDDVCVEVKSGAALSLPQWLRELAAEIKNAKAKMGFIAVRPKGKPNPEDWFIVMPLPEFLELTEKAGML
jgi:hypothetical protein